VEAPHAILDALTGAADVLLTGPVPPDADSLGACLALAQILEERGVRTRVAGCVPWRYAWMPGAERLLPDDEVHPEWDAVVVLDGDRFRLAPTVGAAFERARIRGIIDHHASTAADGYTHVWLQADAESTCGMIHRALNDWGVSLDVRLATHLYAGLVFDTGGFRYSNTDANTHRQAAALLATGIDHTDICARILAERRPAGLRAAGRILTDARYFLDGRLCIGRVPRTLRDELGLVTGDLEGVVDALVHSVGTQVAALLHERDDDTVKVSLRSRCPLDVAALAHTLVPTGGGHAKAAGARLCTSLDDCETAIRDAVAARLDAPGDTE